MSNFLERYCRLKLPNVPPPEEMWAEFATKAHNHDVLHLNFRETVDFLAMTGLIILGWARFANGDLGPINQMVDGPLEFLKQFGVETKLQILLQVSPWVLFGGAAHQVSEVATCFHERRRLDIERKGLRQLANYSVFSRIN